jgi:fluoroquinolone transport system permease protein
MKRLLSTMYWDARLQFRNGFYHVTLFVVVMWVVLVSQLPQSKLGWLLPALVLGNLLINTFYFIGGLMLLEKGEGTLEAQVVTPLRTWEYLASKIATLALLAVVENLVVVGLLYGLGFAALPLVLGIVLAAALYCLAGFIAVARYDSINEYLFPSMAYTLLLSLPLLSYFGLGQNTWFYLHPLQAPLVLVRAAFQPVAAWQLLYGLGYSAVWIGLLYHASQRTFLRFIVAKEGVK